MAVFRRRATTVAAIAVLASVALTGCEPFSDDSESTTPGRTSAGSNPVNASLPDVCALFTKEEAGALLQKPISVAKPNSARNERGCDYDDSILITLGVTTETEFEDSQVDHPQVPNLGDDAFTVSGVLWVRHGTTEIHVIAPGEEVRTAIARKLIEKLNVRPS